MTLIRKHTLGWWWWGGGRPLGKSNELETNTFVCLVNQMIWKQTYGSVDGLVDGSVGGRMGGCVGWWVGGSGVGDFKSKSIKLETNILFC